MVSLDLADRLALPEFLYLVREPLVLRAPEPSSYSSGTQCASLSLSRQEVDLLELESSQIFAFHAGTASCPCDVY